MLTCKQVSRALLEGDYRKLSLLSLLALRLHVGLCVVCGRYNRQVMAFYDGVRAFLRREADDQSALARGIRMKDDTRARLRAAVMDDLKSGR